MSQLFRIMICLYDIILSYLIVVHDTIVCMNICIYLNSVWKGVDASSSCILEYGSHDLVSDPVMASKSVCIAILTLLLVNFMLTITAVKCQCNLTECFYPPFFQSKNQYNFFFNKNMNLFRL